MPRTKIQASTNSRLKASKDKKESSAFNIGGVWFEVNTWKITGVTPLLMNNPSEVLIRSDEEKRLEYERLLAQGGEGAPKTKAKKKIKVYNDNEEASMRVYREDGKIVVYSEEFRKSMASALVGRMVGKTGGPTVVKLSVLPMETQCILLNGKGKPATDKDWVVDKRPVNVGQKGQKIMINRCRAKFLKWSCLLVLERDVFRIGDVSEVTDVLNLAGHTIGICDGKPDPTDGKKGCLNFGKYEAELYS